MNERESLSLPRVSGALVLLGLLVIAAGFVVVSMDGNLEGLFSFVRGGDPEAITQAAAAFQTLVRFSFPGTLMFLIGFGVLTVHLSEVGDRTLAFVAFGLLLIGVTLMALEGTFHASVTALTLQQLAQTGHVPELLQPLREWVKLIQLTYMSFQFTSLALYGWATLRTRVLPSWVAWAAVAWSVVWLVLMNALQDSLPALFFVPVLLIGTALLVYPGTSRARAHRMAVTINRGGE